MKYILMCIGLLAGTYVISLWIIWCISKCRKKSLPRKRKRISIVILWICLLIVCSLCYLGKYYHSDDEAKAYLNSSETVSVAEFGGSYYFDGPGKDAALIFYPGAKVATEAYAPMLHHLAEQGMDVFLVDMPFHMAIFNSDAAEDIIGAYDYGTWILSGHSLGGSTAALYAASHPDQVDGLVLLAAYPTKELDENLAFLSIYGSNDTVLNRESYEENKVNWPSDADEICIDGGNHAQFGNYGFQKGDSEASVSADVQQQETIDAILNMTQMD